VVDIINHSAERLHIYIKKTEYVYLVNRLNVTY